VHIKKYLKEIDSDTTIIAWNQEICQELEKRRVKHKSIEIEYDENTAVKWIKSIAKKPVYDNKNLISLFQYKGTSLWWWIEYWLYASYAYYDNWGDVLRIFYILYEIIKHEDPGKIVYVKEGLLFDKTLEIISQDLGIQTEYISSYKYVQYKLAKKIKMLLIKKFFDSTFLIRKTIFSRLLKQNKRKINQEEKILIIYGCWRRAINYVEPILSELRKSKYNIYALDIHEGKDLPNYKIFREKIKDTSLNHILLEDNVSRKEIKNVYDNFLTIWNSLRQNHNFKKMFEINGINIWRLMEPQISAYFNVRLKNHIIHFIGIDRVVEKVQPNIAICDGETSEDYKALFTSCQKRNIPTLAVQHGILNDLRCIHDKNEVSLKEVKPQYCPIPTVTAVYGKNDAEFLFHKGNYPKDSVIVIGNPRYDEILHKEYDKKKICEKLGLNSDKKIIVLTSVPYPKKERPIPIKIVGEAINGFNNIQFLIKLKPEENISYYENVVKENNFNAVLTNEDNIFEVLFISDILITVNSTAGLEAAILNKPIITLNSPDYIDYANNGIAIETKNSKEVASAINKILNDKEIKEKLDNNRKKYIFNHCYKIDGKAGDRIKRIVESMIRI